MKKSIFRQVPRSLIIITVFAAILRIPYLDRFPPALYSDEIAQGYNAYSILKTGKDEFGQILPVALRSFGDWKPPLQTYIMIPTIAIFGLNEYGVRLSTALFGIFTVILLYYLCLGLIDVTESTSYFFSKNRNKIALLASAFLAISPWHVLQSRSSMLVCMALFFTCLGLWSFIKGLEYPLYRYLSVIGFTLAIYSYYGMRLGVPLIIVYLSVLKRKVILKHLSSFGKTLILGAIILLPLGIAFFRNPNVLMGRVKTVSLFYDQGVTLTVWDLVASDGINIPSYQAQFFHNKPYHYVIDIGRRFFQHLDGRFLFLFGDKHPPFQIPGMGVLYITDGLLLLAGIICLIKKSDQMFKFLMILVFISILPAALTFLTPSANRSFTLVVPLMIIAAIGLIALADKFGRRVYVVGAAVYLISFIYYLHQYTWVLPTKHADWWHYGYKELIHYLTAQETKYDVITISGRASVPYIILLFYTQADPEIVQTTLERDLKDDEFGFEHVSAFGMYQFPRFFNWKEDGERLPSKSLLVVTAKEEVGASAHEIKRILYPNSETAYKIYQIE